ncbi:MAG: nicotinate (nicotinamide) nucleotide adenylyltransferase, partial [bacterium]|nr:nicotinate (nicotinamide) nucleotide adenylyltransferase [bacterium]
HHEIIFLTGCPHWGHFFIAGEIRDVLKLDYVVFVPAAIPPHKLDKDISGGEHRLKMIETAVADYPALEVSAIELNRDGVSYTIDTVDSFLKSVNEITLIVGADNANELTTWKDYRKILGKARVVMVARPGCEDVQGEGLPAEIEQVPAPLIEISSTNIRERVATGHTYRLMVPGGVGRYIVKNRLYMRGDGKEL